VTDAAGLAAYWADHPLAKAVADFWVAHPLARILCEQPAIWAVPLSILLMIVVSKATKATVPADVRMKMLVLHAPGSPGPQAGIHQGARAPRRTLSTPPGADYSASGKLETWKSGGGRLC